MCLNIKTPRTINFPFVPIGKLMILGVLIFKHIRVYTILGIAMSFVVDSANVNQTSPFVRSVNIS